MRWGVDVCVVVVDDGWLVGVVFVLLVGFCDNICGWVFIGFIFFDFYIVCNVIKNKFRNVWFNKMEFKSKFWYCFVIEGRIVVLGWDSFSVLVDGKIFYFL